MEKTGRVSAHRQGGNASITFALALPFLIAVVALVVDLGHYQQVQSKLQTGADAAALAGVRDLNGTVLQLPIARANAVIYAGQHRANGSKLQVRPADVELGTWDFGKRLFAPATVGTSVHDIQAVRVTAHRTAGDGGAVAPFFAGVFGAGDKGLTVRSIAVGGSPGSACAFPFAIPACSLIDAGDHLRCNALLTFGNATTDNVGFTLLNTSNPTTPTIDAAIAQSLVDGCPANSRIDGGPIRVSNGNNFSKGSVDAINEAVIAAGADGLFVTLPVIATPGVAFADCGSVSLNRDFRIAGYVKIRILSATQGPPKSVSASIVCDHVSNEVVGGGLFGLPSTHVVLTQ